MKRVYEYMERWYLGGMMMLLLMLTACASGSHEELIWDEKPVLKLYLFAPSNPIVTRADEGYVDASDAENRIKTLDVWVFEQGKSVLVCHTHVDDLIFDASTGQKEITMDVSKEFAERSTLPRVDVYVAANVTAENCGLTLDKNTSPTALEAAVIEHKSAGGDFFGLTGLTSLTNPIMSVPDEGLPMSGFQKNQEVTGAAPVFSVNKNNVKLVRAVSKVRFVFSKSNSGANPPTISDLTITLNDGMLPKQENLFLGELYDYPKVSNQCKLPDGVEYEGGTLIFTEGDADINDSDDPASYAFDGTTETGQSYEDKINLGLTIQTEKGQTDPDLSEFGRFYLRESDKQLKGMISYKANGVQKDVPFSMASAGDFTRNHTWIVYGYFLGSGDLVLNVVDVKDWVDDDDTGKIHNW